MRAASVGADHSSPMTPYYRRWSPAYGPLLSRKRQRGYNEYEHMRTRSHVGQRARCTYLSAGSWHFGNTSTRISTPALQKRLILTCPGPGCLGLKSCARSQTRSCQPYVVWVTAEIRVPEIETALCVLPFAIRAVTNQMIIAQAPKRILLRVT
ncbi:uncharacterized protein EI90DRAFT_2457006 [Cantharellus anzutake]|uniref:uncharacterized protein n=1 Tax=Cantharellus anzutake TaxID=1750568 RepID=UPI001905DF5C|nr:uncharacterized protein EI90DRAFT_2457006 [Cantharellus anzutake]KAF8339087.1 hypothetical protein EI90DRAFT_2457006 [Cantharellus anzutake]